MTPDEADAFVDAPAAYVHIPFCSAVCPYCDFAVVAGRDDQARRYVDAVLAEIGMTEPWEPLKSVYLGGGTPSHLDPSLLGEIVEALADRHGIAGQCEISLEANPEDFSPSLAASLRSIGFNRVSFGAQSFDDSVLTALGRRHRGVDVESSVSAARAGGFDNVSVDLIFGTPGETSRSWSETLQRAVSLETDHVSAYALTVERGTPLGRSVAAGAEGPDPDVQADRYEEADEVLGSGGLSRYEVSNWARPGHECAYNLTVWAQGEYEAYGNGAHGYRAGRRFRNVRRLDAYLNAVEAGVPPRAGEDAVSGWDRELDRLFVGLRRTVGVAAGQGTDTLMSSREGKRLADAGIVEVTESRLRVRVPLLTDAVHRSVLAQSGPNVKGDGDA